MLTILAIGARHEYSNSSSSYRYSYDFIPSIEYLCIPFVRIATLASSIVLPPLLLGRYKKDLPIDRALDLEEEDSSSKTELEEGS